MAISKSSKVGGLSLGSKVFYGFFTIVVIFSSGIGSFLMSMREVKARTELSNRANETMEQFAVLREQENEYRFSTSEKAFQKVEDALKAIRATASPELAGMLDSYRSLFQKVIANDLKAAETKTTMFNAADVILATLYDMRKQILDAQNMALITGVEANATFSPTLKVIDRLIAAVMDTRLSENAFFMTKKPEATELFRKKRGECTQIVSQEALEYLIGTSKDQALLGAYQKMMQEFSTYSIANFDSVVALLRENDQLYKAMIEKGDRIAQFVRQTRTEAQMAMTDTNSTATKVAFIVLLGGIFLSGLLGFVIVRNISSELHRAMDAMNQCSGEVGIASEQVASASRQLAEGASEQASALEESSSALEEIAAMIRQNADNANQANSLMADTSRVVQEVNVAMEELTLSMSDISQSSEETQKIVRTIDGIAFQTNLLALNAAVEAARAGEAGAGFAVVADEVRNLAMRASEAAKTTEALIAGTVGKIHEGSGIVAKTGNAFKKVAQGAEKVGELVGEITAASSEQAQGIEQVNKAIAEMDQVTQRVASTAEETASAAEEMHSQAANMKDQVSNLTVLVKGGSKGGETPDANPHEKALIPFARE